MTSSLHNPTLSSLEKQIHEEEVRYNEAFRMNAEFHVLKSIRVKIQQLKAELSEQTDPYAEDITFKPATMVL